MRKLIIAFGVTIAASITITAALGYSGGATSAAPASDVAKQSEDAGRVAAALGLTPAQTATLAKAQKLGREATRCLLANGATQGPDGGIPDEAGAATAACTSELETNDAFLESAEFAGVLKSIQPRFEAAARCFSRISGIPQGTIIHASEVTPELQRLMDFAQSRCFRPDGLPR